MNKELAKLTAQMTTQHLGGWSRVSVMIGAAKYIFDQNGAVTFTFRRGKDMINHVKISLVNDLYSLQFSYANRLGLTPIKTIEGVYADNLKRVFEETTGLMLSF